MWVRCLLLVLGCQGLVHGAKVAEDLVLSRAMTQLVNHAMSPYWSRARSTNVVHLKPSTSNIADLLLSNMRGFPLTFSSANATQWEDMMEKPPWTETVQSAIVILGDIDQLHKFLSLAHQHGTLWNPQAKILLLLDVPFSLDTIFSLLFTTWTQYGMSNTVLTAVDSKKVRMFSFFPFPFPYCGRGEVRELLLPIVEAFPPRLHDLGGCPLNVANIHIPPHFTALHNDLRGINSELLMVLASKLNFTINLRPPRLTSSTFTTEIYARVVEDLVQGTVDILPYPYTLDLGEITHAIGWNGLAIAVPRAEYQPLWLSLITPFTPKLWGFILTTFLVVGFVGFLFLKKSFLPILAALLASPPWYKEVRDLSARLFLFTLLVSGMIFNAAYHSSLYRGLTVRVRREEVNTLEQLLMSSLPISGHPSVPFFLERSGDSAFEAIVKRYVSTEKPVMSDLNAMAVYRNMTYLSDELLLKYSNRLLATKGLEVHITQNIAFFLNCLVLRWGSPYATSINNLTARVAQTGLVEKWRKDMIPVEKTRTEVNPEVRLSIEHCTGAFVALIFGLVFSTTVFHLELLLSRIQGKKRN